MCSSDLVEFLDEVIDREEFPATSVNDAVLLSALDLIVAHSVNAADGVILRSALNLQRALQAGGDELVLWTSDKRLARAALREGLTVFDPEEETMDRLRALFGVVEET